MKNTGMIKNIDELGRIVLPKEMRTHLGLDDKTPVELFVDDEKIILQKLIKSCIFCGKTENITEFKEKTICSDCIKDIQSKI